MSAASALLRATARRYRSSGRTVMHFVHGKLRHDPLYVDLLRAGALSHAQALLDLGCGRAALLALLVEARERYDRGDWPADWPAPPAPAQMTGIERHARDVRIANRALLAHAQVRQGDLAETPILDADVVTLFDVLHYLSPGTQEDLLARIAAALPLDGTLLLRVGDASAGWRQTLTQSVDRAVCTLRGHGWAPLHCRTLDGWRALLHRTGFTVHTLPMHRGTPFANVLLTARRSR